MLATSSACSFCPPTGENLMFELKVIHTSDILTSELGAIPLQCLNADWLLLGTKVAIFQVAKVTKWYDYPITFLSPVIRGSRNKSSIKEKIIFLSILVCNNSIAIQIGR